MVGRKAIKTGEKMCNGCGLTKPSSDYYQQGNRLRSQCKMCYVLHNKFQREKHLEKRILYERSRGNGWQRSGREQWNPTEREKHNGYLLRTYGITIEEYEALLEAQGGVCAICKNQCNRSTTERLCVDHHHASGMVRGLLCFQCNVGIGKFQEDADHLRSAIEYLESFATPQLKCEAA